MKKKIGFTLTFIFLNFGLLSLYQNCSDVDLQAFQTDPKPTCISPNFKIDSDNPTSASTRFFVSAVEDDSPISQNFSWTVEGTGQQHYGSEFVLSTTGLVSCTVYRVHAKYESCSQQKDITFDYRYIPAGETCEPPIENPPNDPPEEPVVGCPDAITTPTGTTRRLRKIADMNWGNYGVFHYNQNVTEWDNIWGRFTLGSGPIPPALAWPGMSGNNPTIKVRRKEFLGIHFKTSSSTTLVGSFSNPSFSVSGNVIMAISRTCGDFTENIGSQKCLANGGEVGGYGPWTGVPSSDANLVHWSTKPNYTGCKLAPNTDYYVNVMFADANLDPRAERCPNDQDMCYFASVSSASEVP